jgi:tRNA (cmo5U34)-methyltransferase
MEAEFYNAYDRMIRQVCPDYDYCLDLIAKNIPAGVGSVLDLGSGTGNLALSILKRMPRIRFYGIELQESLVAIARKKAEALNAEFIPADMVNTEWPPADCIVSSLALHNLSHEEKANVFRKASQVGQHFLYFDRFKGSTEYEEAENMAYLKTHMRENGFSEQKILDAEQDLQNNDKPLIREEFLDLADSAGFTCKPLYFRRGLGVYDCTRKE